ncbi:DNA sulfur modification protein DndC [Cognatiyoonia sediminum]|uniref:DNA sulfur modification protein DndC n=1 Tax=Cognatiyoonia sediminum TaxID=1508389 RepID=A0A1M5Q433_9RHOB|nr:phosphoadenosine phosphosulfate reductase family protein [Cognatiyoonia sediminum]SHH08571.1 DNA sulfur modification protein DndC [Cognatiyoonia sediminum]
MSELVFQAIQRTTEALECHVDREWILGFSGGKDSTALLKIFVSALRKVKRFPQKVSVIFCDTGVENPVIDSYVKGLFCLLNSEFENLGLPIDLIMLKAPVEERYFVKVIGRGYPTPTNSFRWCTQSLRIKPVSRFIENSFADDVVVLIGSRKAESQQRRRSIEKMGGGHWQKQVEGNRRYDLFLPILDLSLADVWDSIFLLDYPRSIDPKKLESIYKDASGECPIIKSPDAPPCASGRFGCWTCTVVRKDRSATKMIEAGHDQLLPYLEFRNWISKFRDDLDMRWLVRRNGVPRPGPFSLMGRKTILEKVRELERAVGQQIIDDEETIEIKRLWDLDANHPQEKLC